MNVFIYALVDPITERVRYVGKTSKSLGGRINDHYHERSKTRKSLWIQSLALQGLYPYAKGLEVANESNWAEREKFWIAEMLRLGEPLTNSTSGGQDGVHTPETIEKLRRINLGRHLSEDVRRKLSKINLGKKHGPMPQEQIEKLRQINLGRILTESQRQKKSLSMKQFWSTPGRNKIIQARHGGGRHDKGTRGRSFRRSVGRSAVAFVFGKCFFVWRVL